MLTRHSGTNSCSIYKKHKKGTPDNIVSVHTNKPSHIYFVSRSLLFLPSVSVKSLPSCFLHHQSIFFRVLLLSYHCYHYVYFLGYHYHLMLSYTINPFSFAFFCCHIIDIIYVYFSGYHYHLMNATI